MRFQAAFSVCILLISMQPVLGELWDTEIKGSIGEALYSPGRLLRYRIEVCTVSVQQGLKFSLRDSELHKQMNMIDRGVAFQLPHLPSKTMTDQHAQILSSLMKTNWSFGVFVWTHHDFAVHNPNVKLLWVKGQSRRYYSFSEFRTWVHINRYAWKTEQREHPKYKANGCIEVRQRW